MARKSSRTLWTDKLRGVASTPTGAKSLRTRKTAATPAVRGCRAIILGIDPSLRGTGLAVIDARSEPMRLLASVTLKLGPKLEAYECLGRIADAVEKLVREHTVTHASIEETIYVQNFRTAQAMGASRGAALSVLARLGVKVGGSTPDGRFFIKREEECLAACNGAPMMMVNDGYHENLTCEKVDELLEGLK